METIQTNGPKLIPQDEWTNRFNTLMTALQGRSKAEAVEVREMFNLHNDRFLPHETGVHCGSCVARVFRKMGMYRDYVNELNNLVNPTNTNDSNATS